MKKVFGRILCFFDLHKNYKWKPYPAIDSDCEVDRCKRCGYFEWR